MLFSMTGYGKAECLIRAQKVVVEVRSLNSKQLDLSLRLGSLFRDKEAEIRALVSAIAIRGKVDVAVYTETEANSETFAPIHTNALEYYYRQIVDFSTQAGIALDPADALQLAMRMPAVTATPQKETLNEDDWAVLQTALNQALQDYQAFRTQEGLALQQMFEEKLSLISHFLEEVEPLEKERISKIRGRLEDALQQLSQATQQEIDSNRLEQEMIYYLEKLDINEEKVRLRNHIRYFLETMDTNTQGAGKRLGFIAQEMGREINTLGSKANQSEMQILVVKMKDVLEQIKEQVLNVL